MKKILIGVDGSEASRAALGWAGRLAGAIGADAVAATVFSSQDAEVDPERHDELRAEAERRLSSEWSMPDDAAAAETGPYRSLLLPDFPDALMQAADDEGADLIVVGPQGHGRFASLHIGSLAHHLAHYTTRPLAIVPEPGATRGFDRIVVGLDGSQGSADAARWCAEVAVRADAHIVAVHAFKPPIEWLPESDPRSWIKTSQRELDHWVSPCATPARHSRPSSSKTRTPSKGSPRSSIRLTLTSSSSGRAASAGSWGCVLDGFHSNSSTTRKYPW